MADDKEKKLLFDIVGLLEDIIKSNGRQNDAIFKIEKAVKNNVLIVNKNFQHIARRFDDVTRRLDKIETNLGITVKKTTNIETRLIGAEKQVDLIPEIHKFLENEGIDVAEMKNEIAKLKKNYNFN